MSVDGQKIDVFISYARADRETARQLSELLTAQGRNVWWDWNLIGGRDYRSEIEQALNKAERVIVLWSQTSISSGFVLDEAGHARDRGKLVPVVIDDSSPPFGFGNLHTLTSHNLSRDIHSIEAALDDKALATPAGVSGTKRRTRRSVLVAGISATVAAAGAAAWWRRSDQGRVHSSPNYAATNRIALVIGVNDYLALPDLGNARNDAVAISATLRERGFKVIELLDPNTGEHEIRDGIAKFKTLLALGGVGLFYYAGQAAHIRGKDYLLPRDAADVRDETSLIANSIEIGDVTGPIHEFLAGTPASPRVAGLCVGTKDDCVKVQSPVQSDVDPTSPVVQLLPSDRLARDNGVVMVYAAAEGELAMDGVSHTDKHSPFAQALLDEIGQEDGELSGLTRRVRSRVRKVTKGAQTPVTEDQADAPFYFNRPESDPADGVLRIVMLDSCRDNPFDLAR